jgi:hypothetical protein
LQEDLAPKAVLNIQTGYLISTLNRGPIPYEVLDSVFWTAFVSKQGWFIAKFFETSLSFDEDTHKAIACQRRRKNLPLGRSKSRPVWCTRLGSCGPQIASTFQGVLAVRPIQ